MADRARPLSPGSPGHSGGLGKQPPAEGVDPLRREIRAGKQAAETH